MKLNGRKLSNSQACCLAQLCLAAAEFLSISCGGQTIYVHCTQLKVKHSLEFPLNQVLYSWSVSIHESIRTLLLSTPQSRNLTEKHPTLARLNIVGEGEKKGQIRYPSAAALIGERGWHLDKHSKSSRLFWGAQFFELHWKSESASDECAVGVGEPRMGNSPGEREQWKQIHLNPAWNLCGDKMAIHLIDFIELEGQWIIRRTHRQVYIL